MEDDNKVDGRVNNHRPFKVLPDDWREIMLECGRTGKHVSEICIKLGISYPTHWNYTKQRPEYAEAYDEYKLLCEQWWYDKMHEAVMNNQSMKFNQKLWIQVMKNKFRYNWVDDKQIDITTQGERINNADPIQIEIIKKNLEGDL